MQKKQRNEKLLNAITGIVIILVMVVYYWLLIRIGGFPIN